MQNHWQKCYCRTSHQQLLLWYLLQSQYFVHYTRHPLCLSLKENGQTLNQWKMLRFKYELSNLCLKYLINVTVLKNNAVKIPHHVTKNANKQKLLEKTTGENITNIKLISLIWNICLWKNKTKKHIQSDGITGTSPLLALPSFFQELPQWIVVLHLCLFFESFCLIPKFSNLVSKMSDLCCPSDVLVPNPVHPRLSQRESQHLKLCQLQFCLLSSNLTDFFAASIN